MAHLSHALTNQANPLRRLSSALLHHLKSLTARRHASHAPCFCCGAQLGLAAARAGSVTSDPWIDVIYTTKDDGSDSGVYEVLTGSSDVEGRAIIIHDWDGLRIACALLQPVELVPPAEATGFVPYYTYTGDMVCGLPPARRPGNAS